MKIGQDKTLLALGVVFVIYWLVDFYNNAYLRNDYSWVLWYSSAGFLLSGIALIIQNTKLIYSLFCALFLLEIIWAIDFIYVLIAKNTIVGFTEYVLSSNFKTKDIFFTLYHVLIPIGLVTGIKRSKEVFKYGWVGALIFAFILSFLTFFILDPNSQVNCIHSVNKCATLFSFLYQIENPLRIFVALFMLTTLVYIPTSIALLFFIKKGKQVRIDK